jgi:hypothetical protein
MRRALLLLGGVMSSILGSRNVAAQSGELRTRLESALIPYVAVRDSMLAALRRDPGTARADSTLLALVDTLDRIAIRASFPVFEDARPRPYEGTRIGGPAVVIFLRERWLREYAGEGGPYAELDVRLMRPRVEGFVTAATNAFLDILETERGKPAAADASLAISWDELGDRLASVDRYLRRYPDAVARRRAEGLGLQYLNLYLRDMDNNRLFGWDGDEPLRQDALGSYRRFVARNRDTPSGRFIERYLELLRANGYKRTSEVRAFVDRYVDR